MTPEEFNLALDKLIEDGLRLPHGYYPGSFPGGIQDFPDQVDWDFYLWNPPEYLTGQPGFEALLAADPDASDKPTWAELEQAHEAAAPARLRAELIAEVDRQAETRIAIAYVGRPNRIAELTLRVNGEATAEQDAERLRLIGVATALKASLAAALTIEALEAIDVESDSAWAPPP